MKLTFKLVTATDIDIFNQLVNEKLAQNYKFITGQLVTITERKSVNGLGFLQYSVALLLEEEVQNA